MKAVGDRAHRRPTDRAEVDAVPLHARGNSFEIRNAITAPTHHVRCMHCCMSGVPLYCVFAPDGGQAIIESKVPATTAAVLADWAPDFFADAPSRAPLNAVNDLNPDRSDAAGGRPYHSPARPEA
jgi:hypothetical protein